MPDEILDTDTVTDPVAELKARCEQLERELVQVKQKAESGIVKERWPGKSAQRDKWIFCLRAARIAAEQEQT